MRLILPFLAEYIESPGSASPTPRIGWKLGEFDIGDADPDEFRVAVRQHVTGKFSMSLYFARGSFWKNAAHVVSNDDRFERGVLREGRYVLKHETLHQLQKLEEACGEAEMTSRRQAFGQRTFRPIRSIYKVPPADHHSADRIRFGAWASENLLCVDGRLLARAQAPSLALTWSNAHDPTSETFEGFPSAPTYALRGSRRLRAGIHFDLADEDALERLLESAGELNTWPPERRPPPSWTPSIATPSRFSVRSSYMFDSDIIASVRDDRETAMRSVAAMAGHIANTCDPAAVRGDRGVKLRELRSMFLTGDITREETIERVARLMTETVTERSPVRAFFVNAAVERWDMREIALYPTRTPDSGPGL